MRIKSAFIRLRNGYIRFIERQGFAIITIICVSVITATAVWSKRESVYVAPTPPVSQDISAALLQQQSLRNAATPSPVPTEALHQWTPPLDEISILRPYDSTSMIQSGVSGIWAIHDSADLAAAPGEKVFAMADGVVLSVGNDQLQNVWMLIDHGSGLEALYAGLAVRADYIPGDKVFAGDVIGYTGKGLLDETDLAPHLHLHVTQDGHAIDPVTLWSSGQ